MRRERADGEASLLGALALAALAMLALVGTELPGPTASAQEAAASQLKIVGGTIGGQSVMGNTTDNPVPINPEHRVPLTMTVRNDGDAAVVVRYLRVSGKLLGIRFADFQGSTTTTVAPGETRTIVAEGDFYDVDKVADGYVNATLQAVDEQRVTLASQSFEANVHGNVASTEGLMFLEVLLFALISIADIGVGIYRRRLPRNRFVRAVLFALAAASTVMAVVIAAAIFGVALFDTTAWLPALVVATAGGFALGYLTPGTLERTAPEAAEDKVINLVAAEAVARASGQYARRTTGEIASHASGDHTGSLEPHDSGRFTPDGHDSGSFSPSEGHDSGAFEPGQHDSGSREPLQ
jgi:hypothetical protein